MKLHTLMTDYADLESAFPFVNTLHFHHYHDSFGL